MVYKLGNVYICQNYQKNKLIFFCDLLNKKDKSTLFKGGGDIKSYKNVQCIFAIGREDCCRLKNFKDKLFISTLCGIMHIIRLQGGSPEHR